MPRRHAILYCNIESLRFVYVLNRLPDLLHREEEVGHLDGGEVFQSRNYAVRTDKDMAGEERFQIYECEGVFGVVEYLGELVGE